MPLAVDLIVNPHAGPVARGLPRSARGAFARDLLMAAGAASVRVVETRTAEDGQAAAGRAVAEQVDRVVCWGGDGTVNTVAATLAGSSCSLAVVPGGSGNGFARALGVPLVPDAALRFAVTGPSRVIDLGTVDGRIFVNVAGVGLDAAIARRFNEMAGVRRGLRSYVGACLAEIACRPPARYDVRVDGTAWFAGAADLVAVSNGQQYGHGARIAPAARFDDGLLDVVVVPDVTRARVWRYGWRLFAGSLARVPGVRVTQGQTVRVDVEGTVLMHRDGETNAVAAPLTFAVRPRHLRVIAP